jgi:hypothetical protein
MSVEAQHQNYNFVYIPSIFYFQTETVRETSKRLVMSRGGSRHFHKGASFFRGKNRISKQFVLRKFKRCCISKRKLQNMVKWKMTDEIWNIHIFTSQKIANKGSIGHSLTFYQKQDQQSKIMSLCLSSFTFSSGVECEILVGNSENSRCG